MRARYRAHSSELGRGVRFGGDVNCNVARSGRLVIGDGVKIGAGTTLEVAPGGELLIGDRGFISGYCTIAAERHVSIGSESMLGEMVSIRDHDHAFADPDVAYLEQGEEVAPVRIGNNVWLAGKVTVVKGVTIGDNTVVGAHAVVTRDLPANCVAAGIPARVLRQRTGPPPADR